MRRGKFTKTVLFTEAPWFEPASAPRKSARLAEHYVFWFGERVAAV